MTGDYNSDCRTDMINSNKGACPFEFCHTFHLSVPSSLPVYQMLRICPQSYIGLPCVLPVLGLLSVLLDLCFVLGVHVVAVSSINALICVFPNSFSRIYFLPLCGFLYKLLLSAGITEKCSISSLSPFPCFSSQSELFMSFLSFPICFY